METKCWLSEIICESLLTDYLRCLHETVELTSGDWLLIYSDGISEAATEGGDDFGDNGLLDSLGRLGTGTAAEVCEGVVDEVRNHLREQRQPDDITLITVKVL